MRSASDKLIRKMKTLLLCCILLTAATARTAAQSIEPRVSEEVELMSALARTAGYEEYAMNLGGSYTADIDSCMGPCRTHPAVAFMQEIRRTNGISYDAVMSMALLLKYCDGRFVLMPQQEAMLDKRWATVDKERFLALLSDFHARSRFRDFFVAHEPLYAAGIAAFRESIMTGFDQTWYADFYGTEAQETFTVVIGFCNGGQNYGIRRHPEGGPEEAVSVIGYVVDSNGVPQYDGSLPRPADTRIQPLVRQSAADGPRRSAGAFRENPAGHYPVCNGCTGLRQLADAPQRITGTGRHDMLHAGTRLSSPHRKGHAGGRTLPKFLLDAGAGRPAARIRTGTQRIPDLRIFLSAYRGLLRRSSRNTSEPYRSCAATMTPTKATGDGGVPPSPVALYLRPTRTTGQNLRHSVRFSDPLQP